MDRGVLSRVIQNAHMEQAVSCLPIPEIIVSILVQACSLQLFVIKMENRCMDWRVLYLLAVLLFNG